VTINHAVFIPVSYWWLMLTVVDAVSGHWSYFLKVFLEVLV
jgi:hypothetical protein